MDLPVVAEARLAAEQDAQLRRQPREQDQEVADLDAEFEFGEAGAEKGCGQSVLADGALKGSGGGNTRQASVEEAYGHLQHPEEENV